MDADGFRAVHDSNAKGAGMRFQFIRYLTCIHRVQQ